MKAGYLKPWLDIWAQGGVKVPGDRFCPGVRLKTPACVLCEEACPTGALTLDRDVRLSAEDCRRCGRCASVCPTGYLEIEGFLKGVVETVNRRVEEGQKTLAFSCTAAEHPGEAVVMVPCLSALRAGYLLYWASLGAERFYFNTGSCAGCPRVLKERFQEEVGRVRSLSAAWDLPLKIIFYDQTTREAPAGASGLKFSRRGFFRFLSAEVRNATGNILSNYLPAEQVGGLPTDRLYLLAAVKRLGPVKQSIHQGKWPWLNLVAHDECRVCRVCSTFCPTGALSYREAEGKIELRFQAARCVACGFCLAACPRHCLSTYEEAVIPDLTEYHLLAATINANDGSCAGGSS